MDKEGNIITDKNNDHDAERERGSCTNAPHQATNVVDITGVDKDDATANEDDVTPFVIDVTGVHDNTTFVLDVTEVHNNITGVHNDTTGVHNDV